MTPVTHDTNALVLSDVLPGLMKTCRKLGVSFYRYLGDRLRVPVVMPIPLLPDLIRQAAATT